VYRPPLPVGGPYLRGIGILKDTFPLPQNVSVNLTFIGNSFMSAFSLRFVQDLIQFLSIFRLHYGLDVIVVIKYVII